MNEVKLFENKKIRSVWNAELEEWYLSLVDVIGVLTDSINPTDYLKKLRKRDAILGDYIGTNCPQIEMLTETGKTRKTLSATPKQLFRIVQSIPSKKAEPFKLWLAEVAKDARKSLEQRTGKSAISPLNAKQLPGRTEHVKQIEEYNETV